MVRADGYKIRRFWVNTMLSGKEISNGAIFAAGKFRKVDWKPFFKLYSRLSQPPILPDFPLVPGLGYEGKKNVYIYIYV